MRREGFITSSGQELCNVHPHTVNCDIHGCALHNPTRHDLDDLPMSLSAESDPYPPLMVRMCEHGVEHPDPDSVAYWVTQNPRYLRLLEHECDGCCTHLARLVREAGL